MSKYFFKVNIFSSRTFFEVQCRTIFGTKRKITNFVIDSPRSSLELVLERSFRARLSSSTDCIFFFARRTPFQCCECPVPGGCSWEFLVGVCRPVLQILTYFRPKNVIFHNRFQTWPLKLIPVFRPGL